MKINKDEFEIRYSNWLSMFIDMIKPKDLFLVGGRGLAKTTDILAKRTIDVCDSMPGGIFSITSDTYVNAMSNIIPSLLQGWERQHFYEDYHYVVDTKPPLKWDKPLIKTFDFKHTISTRNGCKFIIKSLDRPSSNAGISTLHNFGDEAKYLSIEKLNKTFPTLRGDAVLFRKSQYFMGKTFTTDMPKPSDGEDPWILEMIGNMNPKEIVALFYAAREYNKIEYELYIANKQKADKQTLKNINNRLENWYERVFKLRKNATFVYIASSLVNIDILTIDYIINLYETLDIDEFKVAVLSMYASLNEGQRFYGALSPAHFYTDGYNYDYVDDYKLRDFVLNSAALRYINPLKEIEAGFDAGNMMSLVFAQSTPQLLRVIKCLYTLSPEWIPELGKKFVEFFKPHQKKVLELYYDRSANNYRKTGHDFASQLKSAIEKPDGISSGWSVRLMSIGQGNISPATEFNLANMMMGEKTSGLPRILFDMYECAALKSSLELAAVGKSSRGALIKVKKSEKKPIAQLPFQSTNFSDAFKYLICRKKWINALKNKKHSINISLSSVSVQ